MKKSIFLVCLVVFGVVSLSAIGPIVSVSRLGWQTDSISYGISRMVDIASLPLLDRGISVHYEGSIDKRGKNADWDWSLYQDQRGEWVIFDVDGPGCIYNLVQHRYMSSSDPLFRFYFDGEETPSFSLHLSIAWSQISRRACAPSSRMISTRRFTMKLTSARRIFTSWIGFSTTTFFGT